MRGTSVANKRGTKTKIAWKKTAGVKMRGKPAKKSSGPSTAKRLTKFGR